MKNVYRLIQGDCLHVLPTLEDKSVDLVITDPPYFLPSQSYVGTRDEGTPRRTLADMSILRGFFAQFFKLLNRVVKPTATYYVFCNAQSFPIFYETMFPYCKYVRLLIWDKIVSYNGYTWRHQHELIAWGEQDDSKRISTGDGDILQYRGVLQKDRLHPAEKPVLLLRKLVKKHQPLNLVIDPFAGSGSTIHACQDLRENCIGIEFDKNYCTTIRKRCFTRQFLEREVDYSFKIHNSVENDKYRTRL